MDVTVEFRVRPVVRYVVTRYYRGEDCGGCDVIGEFHQEGEAEQVAFALDLEYRKRSLRPSDVPEGVIR